MSETVPVPETVVFDTEPLIAYFSDEPGSDTVETYLAAVEGTADGYLSAVSAAELHYIVRANAGLERADKLLDVLEKSGVKRIGTDEMWPRAADFKFRYSLALGDAFALAAAATVDGTLLTGAHTEVAKSTDIPVENFRTEPA